MTWEYIIKTHTLRQNGKKLTSVAYSGKGVGKNNPEMQSVENIGPIPVGKYQIGPAYNHSQLNRKKKLGEVVMDLDPVDHSAYKRTAFRIHGDSSKHPGEASDGCIVLGREFRVAISASGDTDLRVYAIEPTRMAVEEG